MAVSKSTVKALEAKLSMLAKKTSRLVAKKRLIDNDLAAIYCDETLIRKELINYYNQNN
jgi:hypothetical protein